MKTGGGDSEPGIPELPHETKLLNNFVENGSLCRMNKAYPTDLPKATQLLTAIETMNSTDSKSCTNLQRIGSRLFARAPGQAKLTGQRYFVF